MPKIRVKNFGPIKEGYTENAGWIDIEKVTVFIGNQGSGKSTIAKAISTMSWIEKALVRGDFEKPQSLDAIRTHFKFQNLSRFFRNTDLFGDNTLIEYRGDAFNIAYRHSSSGSYLTSESKFEGYVLPKIMYVPAERTFLSVIKNAFDVRGLPETLFTFAEEYKRAQHELNDLAITLPINDYTYSYDKIRDIAYISGDGYHLTLAEASSGIQSFVPLYLVSKNIAELINRAEGFSNQNMSVSQTVRMNEEIGKIMINKAYTNEEKLRKVDQVTSRFDNKVFINIVEEPELNLFPSSQGQMLNSLLEFNNLNQGNKLVLTTHSPYIISYLTLAIQASVLNFKIDMLSDNHKLLNEKLNKIVPLKSAVYSTDVAIYEMDEKTGTISKLPSPEGIPSDKNYLNQSIAEGNHLFDAMLEIEEEI